MTGPFVERGIRLDAVPWSRRGSYMALSMNTETRDHPGRDHDIEPGLYLNDVSGYRLWRWNGVFRIRALVEGAEVDPVVESATPTLLRFAAGDGVIEVTWDGSDTMRFRSRGVGIRLMQAALDPMDAALAFPISPSAWRLQMGEDAHYALVCLAGSLVVDAPRVRTGAGDTEDRKAIDLQPLDGQWAEVALTQYQTGYRMPASFSSFVEAREQAASDLACWAAEFPTVPENLRETRDAAIALLWTNLVAARGNLPRPAVLMSKNWMHGVWSWDHCFVALGLASAHPDLAWDQFMLFFDRQAPDGMLADIITDYGCIWGFCKPPVHGWTLRRLMEQGAVPPGGLAEVYPRLAAWTDWWFAFRDDDGDGLAEYFHGCDSGQDNSAAFDESGFPAASPDLAAFLTVQLDVLADVADRLGRDDESREWRRRSDAHLELLVSRLYRDDGFTVRRAEDGAMFHDAGCQIFSLPSILGSRLPASAQARLVQGVDAVRTAHGLASQAPSSPLHEPDGYWRGPVWAPTTYLIADGLRSCGEPDVAEEVARSFLTTVREGGFAENFDATTGAPLRDRGYSWTAAVFLMFAAELSSPAEASFS